MSRWRRPTRRGAADITPEGAARLKEELHQLWKIEGGDPGGARGGEKRRPPGERVSRLEPYLSY